MVTFTLMVAAAGLVYLVYLRSQHRWLRSFVVYTGAYASWLLFGTYVFFQSVFLSAPIKSLALVFAYVRVGVSFVILISGSIFYLTLAKGIAGKKSLIVVASVTVIISILIILFLGYGLKWAAVTSTLLFNGYFCVLSAYALVMILRGGGTQRRMFSFILYSTVAYFLLAGTTVALLFFPSESYRGIPINVFSTGLFSALWGILIIAVASRWISQGLLSSTGTVPMIFVEDYGISRRESEIIKGLREGLTSKQIGDQLYISQRTVETHIQNIYRKCGVSNRVELINQISRYT